MKYFLNKKTVLTVALAIFPLFAHAADENHGTSSSTSVTGQINLSLTVSPGCLVTPVSSSSVNAASSQWMNLNFPSMDIGTDTTSSQIDVECTSGANPTLMLNGGKYGTGTTRYMETTNGATKLAYTLTSDQAGKTVIQPNTAVTVPSNGDYTIYASTNIPQDTPTGTYSDTVQATLSW